jgi:ubiquinone/menaquinone biosynthesis C-methylase UbiE
VGDIILEKIKLFKSLDQEFILMEKYIKQKAIGGSTLQILEAGCGRRWPLNLSGIQHSLTGVDIDKHALDLRKSEFNDINEVIVGDLRSIELEENKYDVIYNSFVLEHIDNAEHVLDNFLRWLKPGGFLILRIPDRSSVFGFITRSTPNWFHTFYYKYIRGWQNAGKPGFAPYPTFYDFVVSRTGIHEYCRKNHFIIKEEYGQQYHLTGHGIIPFCIRLFVRIFGFLSFGMLAWEHTGLSYILQKRFRV